MGEQVAVQHALCPLLTQVLGPPHPLLVVLQIEHGCAQPAAGRIGLNMELDPRIIEQRSIGARRATSALRSLKDGGREWTGRLLAKHTQNRGGRVGGRRVSWPMEHAGNSLPRNFS